jgi:hypothetical protein
LGEQSPEATRPRNPPIQAFCGYSLREIFACNYLALRKVVRTSHISRNKPGPNTGDHNARMQHTTGESESVVARI